MANRKLPTNYLQIQTIFFFFLKGLQLRRDSKFYPHYLATQYKPPDCSICKCSKDNEPDSLLPVPV